VATLASVLVESVSVLKRSAVLLITGCEAGADCRLFLRNGTDEDVVLTDSKGAGAILWTISAVWCSELWPAWAPRLVEELSEKGT
jgi:hypothetical protein